ncbi:MAG: metal-dependent transcriptional regulator [Chloroflexi bacterium]|nr:metal-dependent transcriptional regulator [Chloroflexota bacterium]
MTPALSSTMRDYLAEIYRLSDRESQPDGYVSTSALADLLDVSAPAVNRMVIKLRDQGLLLHEPYQGIRLTDAGRREALKQLRSHRIVESFLTNVMGFGWHQVHEEADKIAPTLEEVVVERMAQMAGNPTRCPHGEPIPTPDGEIPELHDVLIPDAPQGIMLEITRVRTRESDRLEYMAALELVPGQQLQIVHAAPFNGPIQLRLKDKEFRIIGHNLAEMIRVQPVE